MVCQKSQDMENGGISDRPDDAVDVYHTYFGVAGNYMLHYCLFNFFFFDLCIWHVIII